jgi:hypothetical protein
MHERELDYVALVDPDDFVRWVFPRLFYDRIPRYEVIAKDYGYTITTDDISTLQNEEDFLALVANILDK